MQQTVLLCDLCPQRKRFAVAKVELRFDGGKPVAIDLCQVHRRKVVAVVLPTATGRPSKEEAARRGARAPPATEHWAQRSTAAAGAARPPRAQPCPVARATGHAGQSPRLVVVRAAGADEAPGREAGDGDRQDEAHPLPDHPEGGGVGAPEEVLPTRPWGRGSA